MFAAAAAAAVAVALLAFLAIQPLGALQWRLLLPAPRPGYGRLLRAFAMGSAANNGINSLVGHAAATALVAREPGVGTGPAVALLVLDQLIVGIVKLLVLGLAIGFAWGHSGGVVPLTAILPLGIAVLALGVLIIGSRRMAMLPAWVPTRLRAVLASVHGVLREPGTRHAILRALPVGIVVRLVEAVAVVAVHIALGMAVTPTQLPLFLAATALATMLPIVPANLGTYEGALVGVYLFLGVPLDRALPAAALQHACQLTAAIVPGLLLGTMRLPSLRRSRFP